MIFKLTMIDKDMIGLFYWCSLDMADVYIDCEIDSLNQLQMKNYIHCPIIKTWAYNRF